MTWAGLGAAQLAPSSPRACLAGLEEAEHSQYNKEI